MFAQISMFDEIPAYKAITDKIQKEFDKLAEELRKDFERNNELLTVGGTDPFWSDGVNLDLKRNHILYGKRKIEELCNEYGLTLPDIFFKRTPNMVDMDYQAPPGSKSGRFYQFKEAF